MIDHIFIIGCLLWVAFVTKSFLPKNEIKAQADENIKEAIRIINKKTKINDY
jgi:hypothetical protein